jgi:drug/metabolite transporter (DMT)-like permease
VVAIPLAALAGASFGALTVAVRWGIARGGDPEVGILVAATIGLSVAAAAAVPSVAAHGVEVRPLLPFLGAGVIAPGASQIALTGAVRDAGPSRAAILMGTAPLISLGIAFTLLSEPFRLTVVVGTVLIVLGAIVLTTDRGRAADFRARGVVFALSCAVLFAARDNLVRWAARDHHPPPLMAATALLLAAAVLALGYVALTHRDQLAPELRRGAPAFIPAGVALALGYGSLLAALGRGRVSTVSPLSATGSLWAVLLTVLLVGKSDAVGRRTVLAALLVVGGGAVIGGFG